MISTGVGVGTVLHANPDTSEREPPLVNFEFLDTQGRRHISVVRTMKPETWNDGRPRQIVFDPLNPSHNKFLEELPKFVQSQFREINEV